MIGSEYLRTTMNKIDIFYRICEKRTAIHGASRPEWFSKEKCLTSFLNSVENAKEYVNSFTFIHDGPEGELYELIKNYNILKINEGNHLGSMTQTYNYASNFKGNYFFAEDDYLYLPDCVEKIAISIDELDLLTPYDHLAGYDPGFYFNQPRLVNDERKSFVADKEWKISEFACYTYSISNKLFHAKKDIITSEYCTRGDLDFYRMMYANGHPLWVPVPALATQVDDYMSPNVDWEEFNKTL